MASSESESGPIEAVDQSLRETSPDTMDLEQLLMTLDLGGIPSKERMSLISRNGSSLSATIQKDAWQAAGIERESAGSVETYSYEKHGLILIDLNSHESADE